MLSKKLSQDTVLPLLLVLIVGCLISTLPHLIMGFYTGSFFWITDTDELAIYLNTAAQAYHHHPFFFTDPMFSEPKPTMYPWAQLFPGTFLAYLFGLGSLGISLVWRSLAGLSIGLGWYLIFQHYLRNRWWSCAFAIFLLSESCLLEGKLFFKQFWIVFEAVVRHNRVYLETPLLLHPEWRIITPGLSWFFLQLYIWLVIRAREKPNTARVVLAGLGLGLLFHVYFYFWTAALLGLLLSWVFDSRHWKTYFKITWIGCLFGFPFFLKHYLLKLATSPDWLQRADMFLPIDRFSELIFPKVGPTLLLIAFYWVWKRRSDLRFLWANALAGLLLLNHQIFSHLQIQNFHWNYYWSPFLGILLLLLFFDEIKKLKISGEWLKTGILVLVVSQLCVGLWIRKQEVTRSSQSSFLMGQLVHYQQQRVQASVPPLKQNSVLAGDETFLSFASVLEDQRPLDSYFVMVSPTVTHLEWNDRIALNGILLGQSQESFIKAQTIILKDLVWGPWFRKISGRDELLQERIQSYTEISKKFDQSLVRFKVQYVALDAKIEAPAYLKSGWVRIQEGPFWQIWKILPKNDKIK